MKKWKREREREKREKLSRKRLLSRLIIVRLAPVTSDCQLFFGVAAVTLYRSREISAVACRRRHWERWSVETLMPACLPHHHRETPRSFYYFSFCKIIYIISPTGDGEKKTALHLCWLICWLYFFDFVFGVNFQRYSYLFFPIFC